MSLTLPGFAFIRAPLDRADHLRRDPAALARLRDQAQVVSLDAQGHAAITADGSLQTSAALREDAVLLGLQGEVPWFAQASATPHGQGIDLRSAATHWPDFEATVFAQARAVLHWRATHRYCAACGHALTFSNAGWQGDCAGCGRTQYPRTDPAVIVAVSDGERLLLGRQASWPARRYSTLAGFVEPGETLEQTVQREVWEESRVRVQHSRYLASQPWPFPGSLMLGFIAHAAPDVPQVAQDELEEARWFTHAEVVAALVEDREDAALQLSPPLSISRWLIERWVAGARG